MKMQSIEYNSKRDNKRNLRMSTMSSFQKAYYIMCKLYITLSMCESKVDFGLSSERRKAEDLWVG